MTDKTDNGPVDLSKEVEGTCVFFGSAYGFFRAPGMEKDIFAHITTLPREGDKFVRPANGGRVKFRWGKCASDLTKLEVAKGVIVIDRRMGKAHKAA
ncbi:hypothetical protein HY413_02890 [Candidatus Kaiserbacteria bacterium]|nr:hypothetical protein [Candidatus Kaiserbacteria bacterium]